MFQLDSTRSYPSDFLSNRDPRIENVVISRKNASQLCVGRRKGGRYKMVSRPCHFTKVRKQSSYKIADAFKWGL